MKNLLVTTSLVAVAAFSTAANAQNQVLSTLESWSTELELGYANSNGNTNSTDVKAAVDARREYEQYIFDVKATAKYGSDNGSRDEEKYTFDGTVGRKITDRAYTYGELNYIKDMFSGYDHQVSELVGIGYKAIDNDTTKLETKLGVGGRQSETDTGSDSSEAVVKPELDFSWKANDFVTLGEKANATFGTEYTRYESETYAESALTNNLFLKAAYEMVKTTDVPVGSKETDTTTTVSLVYKFKSE